MSARTQFCVLLFMAVALVSSAAEARSTFGLQLKLGGAVPVVSTFVESTTILVNEDRGGGLANYPYIGDVENTAGWSLGLVGVIRDWELAVNRYAMPYSKAILRYQGQSTAELVGLEIDDADVDYRRLPSLVGAESPYGADQSLVLWTLDAGQRWYFLERAVEGYVPYGGGIVWANIAEGLSDSVGIHLWGGVATDIELGDFAFVFDARMHYIVTNNAAGVQRGADNAAVASTSVFEALLSSMFFSTFEAGIRYRIN